MTNQGPTELVQQPEGPSFLGDLFVGRYRWDLLRPFPGQDPAERRIGDARAREMWDLVRTVDSSAVDRDAALPDDLIEAFRRRGYFKLMVEPALGGLGLSRLNAFRVIETAMSWSMGAGQVLAFSNGIGAGAYLPVLAPGPLRDVISERVARSVISGTADTEIAGAFNAARSTTATPTADGSAYVLHGEKVCVGNVPLAEFLVVTATVVGDRGPRTQLFFVDTDAEGFEVQATQDFAGWRGLPVSVLRLDGVRIPAHHALVRPEGGPRQSRELASVAALGRLLIVSAASLAIARRCLQWSREFVARRTIDGRPLREYDEIQRMLGTSAAEVYAMDAVVEWCLLADSRPLPIDVGREWAAAKNVNSVMCWRIVDRTVSLLAHEGYETATSKARRRTAPHPVERALRDARGLRVGGGVDFNLDNLSGREILAGYYPGPDEVDDPGALDGSMLSAVNQQHLSFVAEMVRRLAEECRRLSRQHPRREDLFEKEHSLICVRRIASELLTMSVTLARASSPHPAGHGQELADVYCAGGRRRLADLWAELTREREPDYASAAYRLMSSDLDVLLRPVSDS